MELITDRTAADVEAQNEKGVYRAEDMNRVESAVQEISLSLQTMEEDIRAYADEKGVAWREEFELSFLPVDAEVRTRTDWTIEDWPTKPQSRRYLQNIVKLCSLVDVPADGLPGSLEDLTYEGANQIEIVLGDCQTGAANLKAEKEALIDQAATEAQRRVFR